MFSSLDYLESLDYINSLYYLDSLGHLPYDQMNKIIIFLRTWKLPVAMLCGVVLYVALEGICGAITMHDVAMGTSADAVSDFIPADQSVGESASQSASASANHVEFDGEADMRLADQFTEKPEDQFTEDSVSPFVEESADHSLGEVNPATNCAGKARGTAIRQAVYGFVTHSVQPVLLFVMLTLSFLKVRPRDLRPHRWHVVLLAVQALLFVACALCAIACRESRFIHLGFVSAMICFVCPTATASAVIVQKLDGSLSGVVTYIVLCNLMVSVLSPAFLTLVEPQAGMTFQTELFMIMGKVFPLLLCPLFIAFAIRHYAPRLKAILLSVRDMAFYLWLVALALAIMVTVRTIVESNIGISLLICFAAVSLVCCLVQFWLGRRIGMRWWERYVESPSDGQDAAAAHSEAGNTSAIRRSAITAGQAFGQKNTIFAIWLALVFLDPVTSVVGGFYSIWHNVINAWQLKKMHTQ